MLHKAKLERVVNERVRGTTPLHEACLRGQFVSVKWLLDVNADPLAMNRSGCIPLHFVAQHQDGESAVQIIDLILQYAPTLNPNHMNERQDTPMHYAAYNTNDNASTSTFCILFFSHGPFFYRNRFVRRFRYCSQVLIRLHKC